MKNDVQIMKEVQEYILASALADEVTGVIKIARRPRDSRQEDVIVTVLANENGQIQQVTVNVNIYVRDLDSGNQKDLDKDRLDTLAGMAQEIFEVFRGSDYRARLLSQRITAIEDEHVITNKIEYKQVNE